MLNPSLERPLPRLADTQKLAAAIAKHFLPPLTIALNGTLGAGKTQWIRYFAQALGVPGEEVTSPTYVLLQRYQASVPIYHFDFYRLQNAAQVWDLGIDELYEQHALVVIEWADRFEECLPDEYLEIRLVQDEAECRRAIVQAHGPRTMALLADFAQPPSDA